MSYARFGEGCVIAAFDERRPQMAEALARAQEETPTGGAS